MKKTFAITMFGTPFPWIQQYIDNVQGLGQYGWNWKIFTPHKFESKGNVEIVPMTIHEFNWTVEKKLGVKPNLEITPKGIPNLHITDFYIFSGIIFEDYLKDSDFWGITNMDVVYGRLDRFIPDSMLSDCDVFSDDVNTINGVFCLFRNTPEVNILFTDLENWREVLSQVQCAGCLGAGKHVLFGSDEVAMTVIVHERGNRIRFKYPSFYPMLSHDRLEQHVPEIKLEIKPDGSLWELFKDTGQVRWEHERLMIGKEIPYFHFSHTKKWPNIA